MTDKKDWNKLIVALDVTDRKQVKNIISTLAPKVKKFKVGLIPYTQFGPEIINWVNKVKAQVFVDLKLYDIPNTMIETAKLFVKMNAWGFTVHAKVGQDNLKLLKEEVVKEAKILKRNAPLVIAVTELTSANASLSDVLKLAAVANMAGVDGVVASAREAEVIKEKYPKLIIVTPGIRNPKDDAGDQKRIMSAQAAFCAGADFIVVGRPIVNKKDYLLAAKEVLTA